MDGNEVKQMLAQRAEEVCRHLLPGGKRIQGEWAIGDVRGNPGKSLKVVLAGPKIGQWADFASVEKGSNLLELWIVCRNLDFREALTEAKDFLGVKDDAWKFLQKKPRQTTPIARPAQDFDPVKEGGAVWNWLTQERKITPEAIRAYKIGEKQGEIVVFPYYSPNDELRMVKYRSIKDKSKTWTGPKGAGKCLFGLQAVDPGDTELFITEGELDAMVLWDLGFHATSVPFGAKWSESGRTDPNQEWIEAAFDWMADFIKVFLCLDSDEAGQRATADIIRKTGRARTYVIDWPDGVKDANEYLLAGYEGSDFYDSLYLNARDLDPPSLKRAGDYREAVWECFYPEGGVEPGDDPPWAIPIKFRPAEVTVWTGYSKNGKTVLLNHMLINFADLGSRVCLCSLEMKPEKNLQNIVRQSLGKQKPEDEKEFHEAMDWVHGYFWIYDKVGSVAHAELLDAFGYAAKKYGIKHFVIDSLMKLTVDEEDNTSQKEFMNCLCNFAVEYDCHVHLVAHSKKPSDRRPEIKYWPGKHDVRGSVHVTDLAHNVVCVWRNREKENRINDLREEKAPQEEIEGVKREHDAMFIVLAQRGGEGDEPLKKLWFDHEKSWQYWDNGLHSRRYIGKNNESVERGTGDEPVEDQGRSSFFT